MRRAAGLTPVLFIALAILHIAPVWSVHYFPTGDGPTHVYNAWVMHGLVTGEAPPNIQRAYRLDWRPVPNWTSHAAMALLIAIVDPIVAEKIVVSLILALFLAGAWVLTTTVDPRNDVYAFLTFPFVYAYTLVGGYYNFTLGVALYLFIVAWWWRHRDRATAGSIGVLTALLILCSLTHAVATMAACGAMVLLSIVARRYRQLIAIVPALIVLAIHSRTEAAVQGAVHLPVRWDAARILANAEVIRSFDGRQVPIALAVAVLFALLLLYSLTRDRWRPAIVLTIVALAMAAVMFWCPAPQAVRDHLTERLSLFVFLTLAASFSPLERAKRHLFLAVVSLLAIANAAIVFQRVRVLGGEIERFVRAFEAIPAGAAVLPLVFSPAPSPSFVDVYMHRFSHVAREKRLADPTNFAPHVGHFPIAYRDPAFALAEFVHRPGDIDIGVQAARFEYLVTFGLPADAPNRGQIESYYLILHAEGETRIYRRSRVRPGEGDLVLLPLLGTHGPEGAPGGARWRIDQTVRNAGSRPVEVRFRRCLPDLPCAFFVAPGEKRRIATAAAGFAMLMLSRGDARSLEIETVARRVDVERPDLSVRTPAVHERAFSSGGVRIENVATAARQISLRVYLLSAHRSNDITVRLRSHETGAILGNRTFRMASYEMFGTADLRTLFGPSPPATGSVDIEVIAANGVRCWAFSTATDANGRTEVHLPSAGTGF